MEKLENRLCNILRKSGSFDYLKAIRTIIPEAWLAGGAIRNTVWKYLYKENCQLDIKDLDVIHLSSELSADKDAFFDSELERICPTGKWECANQAYVHLYEPRGDYWQPNAPYAAIEDSVRDWSFTANAIGVRLNNQNHLQVLAPYGLDDLFSGKVRLTAAGKSDHRPFLKKYIEGILLRCPHLKLQA